MRKEAGGVAGGVHLGHNERDAWVVHEAYPSAALVTGAPMRAGAI